ncbi:hypothetical protein D5086_024559 [Populus alba]|uniref:Uncharacterized protein n=1 Tax=Populus alba TaxID=43335 RepID=A0ACC4B6G3_POPAL
MIRKYFEKTVISPAVRIVSWHLEGEFECVRDMNLQDLSYDHYTLPGETFHMEAMPPKHFLSRGSIASFQGWTGDRVELAIMEVQNQEHHKPNTDQVVLSVDQPDSKLRQPPSPQQPDSKAPLSKTLARTNTLRRLNFSKPKSRFSETNYPPPSKSSHEFEEYYQLLNPPKSSTSSDEEDDEEWWEYEEGGGEEVDDAGEAQKTFQITEGEG